MEAVEDDVGWRVAVASFASVCFTTILKGVTVSSSGGGGLQCGKSVSSWECLFVSSAELSLEQEPAAGSEVLAYGGDVLTFELYVGGEAEGTGYVRTSLGGSAALLDEVIREVDGGAAPSGAAWRDVAMRPVGGGRYRCTLPLCEVGVFEAKCLFVTAADGGCHWVPGANVRIKVEPAGTAARNAIYNAFVRQFGRYAAGPGRGEDCLRAEGFLDGQEYTVLPPSGRFRDVLRQLPHIMGTLGFRVLQLLPVQPPPTTYARMGRYGSPFAPVDYFSVDPSMAEFDHRTTPLEQFGELVDGVHARGGLVLLDLPIDHTGWASALQVEHPEWFCRNGDGSFASPGAWGVVWEDLCKLDFSHRGLWRYLAEVFLHWTRHGVDGFRCDAGYMVPCEVWRYIVARVRRQYPDTLFFLEGLGGPAETTARLLSSGGMDWAYSEIFQVFGREPLAGYLAHLLRGGAGLGVAVNFAETHDNARLAAVSPAWAAMRTALAALTSQSGAFGVANGVEWLATEKIDVHGASSLNWGAESNLIAHLRRLNDILAALPAFGAAARCRLVGDGTALGVLRTTGVADQAVLAVLNPEEHSPAWLEWQEGEFGGQDLHDLLADVHVSAARLPGGRWRLELAPAAAVCLSPRPLGSWLAERRDENDDRRRRQAVLRAWVAVRGLADVPDDDQPERWSRQLADSPEAFLLGLTGETVAPLTVWEPSRDGRRVVPLPAHHFLLVRESSPFRVSLHDGETRLDGAESFASSGGGWLALLPPPASAPLTARRLELRLERYVSPEDVRRVSGAVLLLPEPGHGQVRLTLSAEELTARHLGLCSNRRGSYTQARARWGELHSKYDALLAASLEEGHPADRFAALLRCRAWLVHRGASAELAPACQTGFAAGYDNTLVWTFAAPAGLGGRIGLTVTLRLSPERNAGALTFTRDADTAAGPDGREPVELILRPDVDWRVNHGVTAAYMGPEHDFPNGVAARERGFAFRPSGAASGLEMEADAGTFAKDGAWTYQVGLAEDAQRCLPDRTDVFSPGYFRWQLHAGARVTCRFAIAGEPLADTPAPDTVLPPARLPLGEALRRSLERYLADRDGGRTVIAGFPWFLDWGRDTLICLRGLVAAGRLDDCRGIIRAFASFEEQGTIPNMIRGADSGDRATSDAPLWLIAAAEVLHDALPSGEGASLLRLDCGGRPLLAILESLAWHYRSRLPNGICCDSASGLVFSPPHFTWMDTNYPAGTPREGYPVEIQALWLHALAFLSRVTGKGCYAEWRALAADSFRRLYVRADGLGLHDCLLGPAGRPAADCTPDDAIRPNQLLALTLCPDCVPPEARRAVLSVCAGLLIPGGIRSLDDRPLSVPLPIVRDGVPLNDPHHPYWGQYGGDEDTRRKAAYHNGTAWGWQMPLYCEALARECPEDSGALRTALALLETAALAMEAGCLGQMAEIYDGDAPHAGRGCPAQAWSMSEAYRVWRLLEARRQGRDDEAEPATGGGPRSHGRVPTR